MYLKSERIEICIKYPKCCIYKNNIGLFVVESSALSINVHRTWLYSHKRLKNSMEIGKINGETMLLPLRL